MDCGWSKDGYGKGWSRDSPGQRQLTMHFDNTSRQFRIILGHKAFGGIHEKNCQ